MTREGSQVLLYSWNRRDAFLLALIIGVFLTSRLVWLYVNPASSGYWEESYRWVVAHELLTGRSQPFLEYQADHYQGGSLVMSLLSVPFFQLLGASIFSLKLSALCISTATIAMLYILGRSFFGRPVGLLVSAAYLVGPPLVAYWGLVVMGSHGESTLFSLLQVFLFLKILSGVWPRAWSWALFGLLSGLGIWFCYTSGLTLVACTLTWVLLRKMPRPKELLWATGGGLLGLMPWLLYNLQYEFVGGRRILELFGFGDPIDPWVSQSLPVKFIGLVTHHLPIGLVAPIPDTLSHLLVPAVAASFCIPFVSALLISAARVGPTLRRAARTDPPPDQPADDRRKQAEIVFVVYAVVFLAVFLVSQFSVDPYLGPVTYRLFVPLAVLLLIPAAISAVRGFDRGSWRRAASFLGCVLCLTASLIATLALALREPDSRQILGVERGYMVMGVLLHRKFEGELERALAAADRITHPDMQYNVRFGIGWGMEFRFEKEGSLENVREALSSVPPEKRMPILAGINWALHGTRNDLAERIKRGEQIDRHRVLLRRLQAIYGFAHAEKRRLEKGPAPSARPGSNHEDAAK
jgi:4-amino-4-deoxy-L-arabinose transferase-like glycosyltransferase